MAQKHHVATPAIPHYLMRQAPGLPHWHQGIDLFRPHSQQFNLIFIAFLDTLDQVIGCQVGEYEFFFEKEECSPKYWMKYNLGEYSLFWSMTLLA